MPPRSKSDGRASAAVRSIVTRTGDDGTTALLFNRRVPKDHPRVETSGALDELNAALGVARAAAGGAAGRRLARVLVPIQRDLVALMGEVACLPRDRPRYRRAGFARLTDDALARLDREVAVVEAGQPRFDGWATPGKNARAAALDLARTIARRAERRLVALHRRDAGARPLLQQYLNRLSDLLWLLARAAEG